MLVEYCIIDYHIYVEQNKCDKDIGCIILNNLLCEMTGSLIDIKIPQIC